MTAVWVAVLGGLLLVAATMNVAIHKLGLQFTKIPRRNDSDAHGDGQSVSASLVSELLSSDEMLSVLNSGVARRRHREVDHASRRYLNVIRSHMTRPSDRPRILATGASQAVKHFSQFGQSKHIDNILNGRRNGFFIECGAYDGEMLSNSLFFELERNWTGLLIEANPRWHQQILAKNRRAFVLGSCLSPTGQPTQLTYVSTNTLVAGIDGHMIKRYADSIKQSFKLAERSQVPCFPLNDVLAVLGITHVDYFSLDVDGAELDILRTIDWSTLTFDVLTVEFNEHKQQIIDFFASLGVYQPASPLGPVDLLLTRKDLAT